VFEKLLITPKSLLARYHIMSIALISLCMGKWWISSLLARYMKSCLDPIKILNCLV